jgi:acetate---CoA ligase (ADP-forming)
MRESRDLGRLLDPRSVAVVGATDAEGRPGRIVFEMVRASGRVLHAVNPGKKEILGQPAVSRVSDLPGDVDLAIITTAARPAVEAAEECASHGIPYLIVMAGGFGETGEEGRALESRLRSIPASTGTRILGPNSLGVFLPAAKMDTIFVEHGDRALAGGGSVAFVTQSGSVGVESLGLASNTGFGMYAFVGLGNKCDLDEVDFLRHFGRDPHVRCLSFYLESLDRGREFLSEARGVSRQKPVVVLKAGRGASAASAVSSHTGRLAGSSLVAAGAFRQFGILSVLDDEELCDAAKTLAALPLPRGNRVAVVTPAGGYGVMAADYVESRPRGVVLRMAELAPATEKAIREVTLPFASCRNPVDLTASADDAMFGRSIDAVLADPGVDILVCIAFFAPPQISDGLVDEIARRAAGSKKPVLVFTQYGPYTDVYLRRFATAGVIGFPSIRRAVRAASVLVERAEVLAALQEEET